MSIGYLWLKICVIYEAFSVKCKNVLQVTLDSWSFAGALKTSKMFFTHYTQHGQSTHNMYPQHVHITLKDILPFEHVIRAILFADNFGHTPDAAF